MTRTPEGFSVLVVDDNPEVLSLLTEYLRNECDFIDGAKDALDALEKFKTRRYDLIITDLNMPQLTGIDLMKSIRALDKLTEFIIITAYASLDTAIEAVKLGAFDYIIKPFRLEELKLSVKNAREKILLRKLNMELFSKLEKLYREMERYGTSGIDPQKKDSIPTSDTEHLVEEIRRLESLKTKIILSPKEG